MGISITRRRASEAAAAQPHTKALDPTEALLGAPPIRRQASCSAAILLLLLLVVWCSSTLLSGSFFHICISSRKLHLFCISGGAGHDLGFLADNASTTLTTTTTATKSHGDDAVEEQKTVSTTKTIDEVEEKIIAMREVEAQMRLLRSYASNNITSSTTETCEGRGVYVYDLPSRFNTDLLSLCHELIPWTDLCPYFTNAAMGEPLPALGPHWHLTHQYSLEPIFHSRALNHRCRVHTPSDARLFYVPFYGGLDILRWHFTNATAEVKDALGLDLVRWLENQSPWWGRRKGKDHMFVLGKISWDFRRTRIDAWGSTFLDLPEMRNPYKFLIERQPWEVRDVGIPHPTHFHPHTDDDITAWQAKAIASPRNSLVGFAGAARPEAAENIRSILIRQCLAASSECRFLNCSDGGCDDAETVMGVFLTSEFCLQPPGDSPTRKSVFDSLVAGCIPVLFDPFTTYYQYPWHLPEERERYSVFIDQEEVRGGKAVDVMGRLRGVGKEEREEMRRYIVNELMPGLVYGDATTELRRFRDAFGIVMDNVMQAVTRSQV